LVFAFAPAIVWILIGADNLDEQCLHGSDTPDIAVWLTVEGGALMISAIIMLVFVLPCAISEKVRENAPGVKAISIALIPVNVLLGLFHFAWLIVGAIRLSQADDCEDPSGTLYKTTYAAVVMGFIGAFFQFCTSFGK
jgi:hypothetical protein